MKSPFLIHAGLAFLNLVGLGSGYLFLRAWKRWVPAFLIAVGLLTTALLNDSIILLILLAVWLLLLAADGFLQARKHLFEEGRLAQWPWLPIPVGLLFIGLYALAAMLYTQGAQAAYDRGMARYLGADCHAAAEELTRVIGFYRLADPQNNRRAEEIARECRFFVSGDTALQAGEYAQAIDSFDTYLAAYSGSPITQQTIDKSAEAYQLWAAELRGTQEFETALDKYTELAVKYPNATQILDLPAEITATHVEWGDYHHQNSDYEKAVEQYRIVELGQAELSAAHDLDSRYAGVYFDWAGAQRADLEFESAIQNYQLVIDSYPGSSQAGPAADDIPPTYYEWAQQQMEDGDAQAAIDIYDLIIENYPKSESAGQAQAARAAAFLGLAKNLLEEGKFNDAIEMYTSVRDLTTDGELLAQADAGIEETITGLSMDRGSEGQKVMEDVLRLACDHRPADSPTVNTLPDQRGKFLACSDVPSSFYISDDLRAQFPAEFRYAVLVAPKTTDLTFNRYGPRGEFHLIRQRVDWVVTVVDISTGQTVGTQTFTGGTPPDFPFSWYFRSNPDYLRGDPPPMADVMAWLVTIY